MNADEPDEDAQRVLEEWIEGRAPLEAIPNEATANDPLLGLLVAARKAAPQLSQKEAARVFSSVCRQTKVAHRRWSFLPWAAAAAVILAVLALWPWQRPAPPRRTIVKQMLFEAKHQGKVVRLEMTVYRVGEKKGERHVAKPSL